MDSLREGAWTISRMLNGDVRLEYRVQREYHWQVILSIHFAAVDWVGLIAQASDRTDSEGILEAGDFHLGKLTEG